MYKSCHDVHNSLVSCHTSVFDHIVVSLGDFVAHLDHVTQGLSVILVGPVVPYVGLTTRIKLSLVRAVSVLVRAIPFGGT